MSHSKEVKCYFGTVIVLVSTFLIYVFIDLSEASINELGSFERRIL